MLRMLIQRHLSTKPLGFPQETTSYPQPTITFDCLLLQCPLYMGGQVLQKAHMCRCELCLGDVENCALWNDKDTMCHRILFCPEGKAPLFGQRALLGRIV